MFFNGQNPMFPFSMPNMQMFQMPFPFQMNTAENPKDEDGQPNAQQNFNPFSFFQMPNMNMQMPQFANMFKGMFGMNQQDGNAFNPFSFFQMPSMNMQMSQMEQLMDLIKKVFEMFIPKSENENGLPFGMPVKLLQLLLHLNSTPEGLSKFQKLLDLVFESYSKARTAEAK